LPPLEPESPEPGQPRRSAAVQAAVLEYNRNLWMCRVFGVFLFLVPAVMDAFTANIMAACPLMSHKWVVTVNIIASLNWLANASR
jgi:hypothetical protein